MPNIEYLKKENENLRNQITVLEYEKKELTETVEYLNNNTTMAYEKAKDLIAKCEERYATLGVLINEYEEKKRAYDNLIKETKSINNRLKKDYEGQMSVFKKYICNYMNINR